MTRDDLIDARALIIASHLKAYREQVEAEPIMSDAKAATHAYRHARKLATAITEDDARIARVAKGGGVMDYPFLIKLGLTFGAVYLALLVPVVVVLTAKSKRWASVVMGAHFVALGLAFLCVVAQGVRTVWGI